MKRLWCKLSSARGNIRVYVTDRDLDADGVDANAYFDPETNEILVRVTPAEDQMKMWLLHELLHVCWADSSGDLREKILGAKTYEQRHEREELIVSFLEPVLYDLLTRNGCLKLPRPPRITKTPA